VHAVGGGATFTTPPVPAAAIFAEGGPGYGVYATSGNSSCTAVGGVGTNGAAGAAGASDTGPGVIGIATQTGTGVYGTSATGTGVTGASNGSGNAVVAQSAGGGWAVYAQSTGSIGGGILCSCDGGPAGWFMGGSPVVAVAGDLEVDGTLYKANGGFKIDHPLDPANKYLYHSFVESSEMKNVYDGVVTLDSTGRIEVEIPAWFEALNRDFRYQLTPIGAPAPDLHIARKVSDGRFAIAGGQSGLEVSWQVTGVGKDAWAQANPLEVEKEKPLNEQGFYIHPELHGEPEEKGMAWARHPDIMRRLQNTSKPVEFMRSASDFMTPGQLPS